MTGLLWYILGQRRDNQRRLAAEETESESCLECSRGGGQVGMSELEVRADT